MSKNCTHGNCEPCVFKKADKLHGYLHDNCQPYKKWHHHRFRLHVHLSTLIGAVIVAFGWIAMTLIPFYRLITPGNVEANNCPEVTNVSILINGGEEYTISNEADVTFTQSQAEEMRISEDSAFRDAQYEEFEGNSLVYNLSDFPGEKTLYMQFKNKCGSSMVVSDSIELVEPEIGPEGELINPYAVVLPDKFSGCEIDREFDVNLQRHVIRDDVVMLKELMMCMGFYTPEKYLHGLFDLRTEESVKVMQEEFGLEATGKIDPPTKEVLNEYYIEVPH